MPTITIRAPNSVTALELVQKRLGEDAIILSTRTVDGVFEILATNDSDDSHPTDAERNTQKPKVDILIKDDQNVESEPPVAEMPKGPSDEETLIHDAVSGQAFGAILLRRKVIRASRVVFYGSVGSGKSIAALQLALLRMAEAPDEKVNFFFCGSGSWSDGAMLAQKSHMFGMTTVFSSANRLPAPTSGTCQIVVISGRCDDGPDQLGQALETGVGVLVLSAGQRADHVVQVSKRWKHSPCGAVVSLPDFVSFAKEDSKTLSEIGLSPLWTSSPDKLLDGLVVPRDPEFAVQKTPIETLQKPNAHPVFKRRRPLVELPI